jgi:hypothetical protein
MVMVLTCDALMLAHQSAWRKNGFGEWFLWCGMTDAVPWKGMAQWLGNTEQGIKKVGLGGTAPHRQLPLPPRSSGGALERGPSDDGATQVAAK